VAIIGRTFSGLGFACALLDHRSGTTDKFPAQIEDVAAGFAWVKKHIAGKGGDPKQVYVMGHSSGGHLSVLLATDPKYLAKYRLAPSDIAGVVGLSPIVDLVPRDDGKGFGNQAMNNPVGDVFSRDKAVMKDASPIQHISKDLPRTLLIVGDKDFPMLEGDAKVFVEKAKAAKATASLSVAENCNHLGVVQSLLNPKSPVMEQILDFLKASASKP
jgi:acetyl esterase/lipase